MTIQCQICFLDFRLENVQNQRETFNFCQFLSAPRLFLVSRVISRRVLKPALPTTLHQFCLLPLVVTKPPCVPWSCSSVLCVTLLLPVSPDPSPVVLLSSAGLILRNNTKQSTHQRFHTHLILWPAPAWRASLVPLLPLDLLEPGPSISPLDTLTATPSSANWFLLPSKQASLCSTNLLLAILLFTCPVIPLSSVAVSCPMPSLCSLRLGVSPFSTHYCSCLVSGFKSMF